MSERNETEKAESPYRGGLKIGEEVEVDGTELRGYVLNLVPNTEEVIVDHGLYSRAYHWMRLNYPE